MKPNHVIDYNRQAWDRAVSEGNPWTCPVSSEEIRRARDTGPRLLLTGRKHIPADWLGDLQNLPVLCLAGGGGQQGPLLAAAGADVTVFDNSPAQLQQDEAVAEREKLSLRTEQGDAADLSRFPDASFELIVHPVSNCFFPDLQPVWNECFRVLRPGGFLLSGFLKPEVYIFDAGLAEKGEFVVRHTLPFSDLDEAAASQRQALIERGEPLEFSHTLEAQIGGQLAAGFEIIGFYEDSAPADFPVSVFFPVYAATRARKPIRKKD